MIAQALVSLEILCADFDLLVCLGSRNHLILTRALVGLRYGHSLMAIAIFRSTDRQTGHFEGSKSHVLD